MFDFEQCKKQDDMAVFGTSLVKVLIYDLETNGYVCRKNGKLIFVRPADLSNVAERKTKIVLTFDAIGHLISVWQDGEPIRKINGVAASTQTLELTVKGIKGSEPAVCPKCGKQCQESELVPQPDPYAADINGDYSDVVKCDVCRDNSAQDILEAE